MHAPLEPSYQVEWRGLSALESIAGEWNSFAARALEPNVFYGPQFMLAAAPVFGASAGALLVRTTLGKLVGLFPARIDRLFLNGTAVAATITLASGDTAWCGKIAYNEGLSRSSPGVQLVCDLTESLLAGPMPLRVDSCATAGHPMIDHVWRERLTLSDRLIALRPSAMLFAFACGAETLRRSAFYRGQGRARPHSGQLAVSPSPAAAAGSPCLSWSSAVRR